MFSLTTRVAVVVLAASVLMFGIFPRAAVAATAATGDDSIHLTASTAPEHAAAALDTMFVNEVITRAVNLRAKVPHITITYKSRLQNDAPSPASFILLAFPIGQLAQMTFPVVQSPSGMQIAAVPPTYKNVARFMRNEQIPASPPDLVASSFVAAFPTPVSPGQSVEYKISYYLGHQFAPLPAKIALDAEQKVTFHVFEFIKSHYQTESQTTTVQLPSPLMRSVPVLPKNAIEGHILTIGPHTDIGPRRDGKEYMLHFNLPRHLGHFEHVERYVRVPHYGSVSVHEEYYFANEAAGLAGEFDRKKIAKLGNEMAWGFRGPGALPASHLTLQLEATLPPLAYGLEFFDSIGNISNSHARHESSRVALEFEPRYPVLGGWTADWYIEYKLPRDSVVSIDKAGMVETLTIPFASPVQHVFTDLMTTHVSLPSGATPLSVDAARPLYAQWVRSKWGWFDIIRPHNEISFSAKRVYLPKESLLAATIQVSFENLNALSELQKPAVLLFLASLPFLIIFVNQQCKIRIASPEAKASLNTKCRRAATASKLCDLAATLIEGNKIYLNDAADFGESDDNVVMKRKLQTLNAELISSQVSIKERMAALCEDDPPAFGDVMGAVNTLQSAVTSTATDSSSKVKKSSVNVAPAENHLVAAIRKYRRAT